MKAKGAEALKRYKTSSEAIRLIMLGGPSVSAARELTNAFIAAMPADAEKVDVTAESLSGDPALLSDEARAISLFGSARYLLLSLASGDGVRVTKAIETLLADPARGDPVIVYAPSVVDKQLLAKIIADSRHGLYVSCYDPKAEEILSTIRAAAQAQHLQIGSDETGRLAALCDNDLALIRGELEKYALYCDAAANNPGRVDMAMLDRLAAGQPNEDFRPLIHLALNGDGRGLAKAMESFRLTGINGVGLVRVLLMHLMKLAKVRAAAGGRSNVDDLVGNPRFQLFYEDRTYAKRQLAIWSAPMLARLIDRTLTLETALKSSNQPDDVLVEQELTTIVRMAGRGRN